jgi:succinoglycan biosynthesis protein ExoM
VESGDLASVAPSDPVALAVLTYRRPDDLAQALPVLVEQAGTTTPSATVLVVDNDPDGGAREVVENWADRGVVYAHEPRPGIAAARNAALDEAERRGVGLLVFIDDDERPSPTWLADLLALRRSTGAAAVVGPVVSQFDQPPSPWVEAGRFFDRRRLATGTPVTVAATNNLLLDLAVVRASGLRFDEQFGLSGGSDTLFTRQLVAAGHTMVWCDEAVVVDRVPPGRVTRDWVLRRALRSGNSWSRTSLHLAAPGSASLVTRVRLCAAGLLRLLGGSARAVGGVVTTDRRHQARGARTAARGLGMLLGGVGWTYVEYRRDRS